MNKFNFKKIKKGYVFENYDTNKKLYLNFNKIGYISGGFAGVYKRRKGWNFININDISCNKNDIFSRINDFSNKVLNLYKKGIYNNFNEVELLFKENKWFNKISVFVNGYAKVYKRCRGWNLINTQGELLYKGDKWFDCFGNFSEGFAVVWVIGKGYNFINKQGELLWKKDKWFNKISVFVNGYAKVYKKGRGYNYINTKGELLYKGDKWFDDIKRFFYDFAIVYKKGKGYNFINTQGELLWNKEIWFDDVDEFRMNPTYYCSDISAKVKLNNKTYKLTPSGELISL